MVGDRKLPRPRARGAIDVGHRKPHPMQAVADRFGDVDVLGNDAGMNERGPIERYARKELALRSCR